MDESIINDKQKVTQISEKEIDELTSFDLSIFNDVQQLLLAIRLGNLSILKKESNINKWYCLNTYSKQSSNIYFRLRFGFENEINTNFKIIQFMFMCENVEINWMHQNKS